MSISIPPSQQLEKEGNKTQRSSDTDKATTDLDKTTAKSKNLLVMVVTSQMLSRLCVGTRRVHSLEILGRHSFTVLLVSSVSRTMVLSASVKFSGSKKAPTFREGCLAGSTSARRPVRLRSNSSEDD